MLDIQGGPHPVYPWEMGVARPLLGLPMLRVNAEIPKPVAPYCPVAGERVEAEGKAIASKRSFVVEGAGPPPDVQDAAERAHQVAKWVKILVTLQEFGAAKHIKDVYKVAEETLEVKATLTVATRACSFEQYLRSHTPSIQTRFWSSFGARPRRRPLAPLDSSRPVRLGGRLHLQPTGQGSSGSSRPRGWSRSRSRR